MNKIDEKESGNNDATTQSKRDTSKVKKEQGWKCGLCEDLMRTFRREKDDDSDE